MEGPELILSVGEIQSVSVRVVAKDCREVSVKFQVDERHLEIVSEPAEPDLGAGTFERIVDWRLRARKPGGQTKHRDHGDGRCCATSGDASRQDSTDATA